MTEKNKTYIIFFDIIFLKGGKENIPFPVRKSSETQRHDLLRYYSQKLKILNNFINSIIYP